MGLITVGHAEHDSFLKGYCPMEIMKFPSAYFHGILPNATKYTLMYNLVG